jgi:lantibiotic transport system ATP-binding protein
MLAIETRDLNKRYGACVVVEDVSLKVPQGCVYGFLGPNGSGKTTTMRLLLGLLRPDGGSVHLNGHDLKRNRRIALAHVGAFVESPSLYEHLGARSNLEITCRLLDVPFNDAQRVLEIVQLHADAKARVSTFSLGMKQRLALARALLGKPRLLLLDEPTNGLDPDGIVAMRELIRHLPEQIGGTVFVSSHMLAEVQQIANHAGLMLNGRLIIQDDVRSLLGTDQIIAIAVDDAVRAKALLQARGMIVEPGRNSVLRLRCSDSSLLGEQASVANRALVEAGLQVAAIVPEERTLENVYRNAIAQHPVVERQAA